MTGPIMAASKKISIKNYIFISKFIWLIDIGRACELTVCLVATMALVSAFALARARDGLPSASPHLRRAGKAHLLVS